MAENNKQATPQDQEQDLSQVLKVRRDKLAALQKEGKDPFQQTKFTVSHHAQEIKEHFDEMEGQTVTVAGRLMSKRGMGKAIFCDIQDDRGQIQLYVRKDAVTEQEFADFRKYDIGDIIGVATSISTRPCAAAPEAPASLPPPCSRPPCTAAPMATHSSGFRLWLGSQPSSSFT